MVLRVGYVREHFSAPLLQFNEDDAGKTFALLECPGGTGQLIAALNDDRADIVVALTDALIAGIANGSETYRLVGSYVNSPLNWAVIAGKESKYNSIADLEGSTLGISRPGSGSQVMAAVMALQHGWSKDRVSIADELRFKVNNDIHGLIQSVNDGSTSAFMWEWFTTKPWMDRGEVRFIGSVPTPWPSWMIAAHVSTDRVSDDDVRAFTAQLTSYVRAFDSPEKKFGDDIAYIKEKFAYKEEDIEAWLRTVSYTEDCTSISGSAIAKTLNVLNQAGVVKRPLEGFKVEKFLRQNVVRFSDE